MAIFLSSSHFLPAAYAVYDSASLRSNCQNRSFPALQKHNKLQIKAAGSTYGNYFRVTTFGEAYGGGVGCVIDGCPPRIPLSRDDLNFLALTLLFGFSDYGDHHACPVVGKWYPTLSPLLFLSLLSKVKAATPYISFLISLFFVDILIILLLSVV